MSLIAEVSVNYDIDVGRVVIRRVEGGTYADDMNTYVYTIHETDRLTRDSELKAEGKVVHRYGDGGMRLLLKVLLDAERHL